MRFLLKACFLGLSFVAMNAPSLAASIEELSRLSGQEREKALIAGARAEGKVVMYSAMIENQALRPLKEAFKLKYPFIDVEFWRADTRDLINKTLAEVRARNVNVDVIEGGGVSQALLRANVLAPFALPEAQRLAPSMRDPRGYWVATRVSYFGMAYNTKMVPADEVPKTYADLLDPKWKGRMPGQRRRKPAAQPCSSALCGRGLARRRLRLTFANSESRTSPTSPRARAKS